MPVAVSPEVTRYKEDLMAVEQLVDRSAQDFANRDHQMLIGGKWVDAASGETFETINPATEEVLSHVPRSGEEDVERAVRTARAAFEDGSPWRGMSPSERGRLIWRIADLIEEHADEFATLEALDNGKPFEVARQADVPLAIDLFRYMAGWATKIEGEVIPISALPAPGEYHAYTRREPVGVVAQIIPWNFPLLMCAWKLGPALAAGCTVILKPAEQTPLEALRLGELIQEAGLPDGVVNVLTGYGDVGAALAAHPAIDKVAFTGSTEVGKKIVQAASGNLKKVTLELGGKSPNIVFADADLESAAAGAAHGIFFNHGQCCNAGSRLYVQKSAYDDVVAGVAEEAKSINLGSGLEPNTDMGPLISEEQFDKVLGYLQSGREEGAETVIGGGRWGDHGYFVQPTVLTDTSPKMSVEREEIFGPVLCAVPFESEEDLVEKANQTEYGLAAGVFTRDLSKAHRTAARIKAGTVWVNCYHVFDAALPFGGYKQSGWGREMGHHVLENYTQTKAVCAAL